MILSSIETKEFKRYTDLYSFLPFIKNKTFLITGSNGMMGSGIIKWLLYENTVHGANCRIFASTRYPQNRSAYLESDDNVVMCQFGMENQAVSTEEIDYIIHTAAPTDRKYYITKPVETLRVIVEETEKMLDLAKEKNAQMVYLSSVEAYGVPNTDAPIKEDYVGAVDSLDIRNGYPMGKKAAEFLCYAMSKEYGVNVCIIRLSSIQGLFQSYDEQRIFNEILRCVIEGKDLIMRSDGLSKKPFVYSLDAISGILTALFRGEPGEAYNITNPSTYMTMRDLVSYVFERFNPDLHIVFDIEDTSKTGYLPHLAFTQDISKLQQLGWKPVSDIDHIYKTDLRRFVKNDIG